MFKKKTSTDRFQKIYTQGAIGIGDFFEIWVDTKTGVNYVFHPSVGGYAGLAVMLDENGKPVVTHDDLNSQ